ncbi:MAG: hypothetical protein ACSLEY_02650 [Candidatus Saccharimonadales bacterium]
MTVELSPEHARIAEEAKRKIMEAIAFQAINGSAEAPSVLQRSELVKANKI